MVIRADAARVAFFDGLMAYPELQVGRRSPLLLFCAPECSLPLSFGEFNPGPLPASLSVSDAQRLAGLCDGTGEPLSFGVDLNAARYVDGRRETPNGEASASHSSCC